MRRFVLRLLRAEEWSRDLPPVRRQSRFDRIRYLLWRIKADQDEVKKLEAEEAAERARREGR